MFNKNLGTCQLTNEDSNVFFENIVGYGSWHFKRDYSLLAVVRALLYNRLKQEDGIFSVKIKEVNYSMSAMEPHFNNTHVLLDTMVDPSTLHNNILMCNVATTPEASAKIFEIVDSASSGFLKLHTNFRESNDLRAFVGRHNINARFFVSDEAKSTVIIVEKMELRSYHFLISLVPRYIRWYLTERPLDAEEIQLCKALTEPYSLKFEKMIAEFCSRIDFRSHNVKRIMGDFERKARRRQLRDAERRVNEADERIRQNIESYKVLIKKLDEERIRLAGIQQVLDNTSDNSELIQYILKSKYINPTGTSERSFGVIIHSYLDVFDPEMAGRMLKRDSSVLLSGYSVSDGNSVFRKMENRKKILSAIFSEDCVLKIKTCSHFTIDLSGEVYPSRAYRYPDEYADMIPNPHLDRYTCLGQNYTVMRERILAGDTVGCLMQCVMSAKCLNVADTTVVSYFMDRLFHSSKRIIELPDKSSVTLNEAFEWLVKQEAENAQSSGAESESAEATATA